MRKIKFRVWYRGNENIMRYDGFCLNPIQNSEEQNGVIMQFTGLLDKNGKEIYEGDIMKTESGICEVKWYDKGACFRWMFDGNSESPLNYDDREVIGNIYENPELLANQA